MDGNLRKRFGQITDYQLLITFESEACLRLCLSLFKTGKSLRKKIFFQQKSSSNFTIYHISTHLKPRDT